MLVRKAMLEKLPKSKLLNSKLVVPNEVPYSYSYSFMLKLPREKEPILKLEFMPNPKILLYEPVRNEKEEASILKEPANTEKDAENNPNEPDMLLNELAVRLKEPVFISVFISKEPVLGLAFGKKEPDIKSVLEITGLKEP